MNALTMGYFLSYRVEGYICREIPPFVRLSSALNLSSLHSATEVDFIVKNPYFLHITPCCTQSELLFT